MSERLEKRADDFAESCVGLRTNSFGGDACGLWVSKTSFRNFCLESLLIEQESLDLLQALSEELPQPDARLYIHINRLKARLGMEG